MIMKKLLYKLPILLILFGVIAGCEEEPIVFPADSGEAVAAFNSESSVFPVSDSGDPTTTVVVGVTTKSDMERTFSVSIDPSSTISEDAVILSDLVIPAGEFTGTVNIQGVFENLPEPGIPGELILNLVDVTNARVADYRDQHTVTMFRFCPFPEGSDFLGDYELTVLEPGAFGRTLEEGVVTITEGTEAGERRFTVMAYPEIGDWTPFSFRFSLICGKILVQQRNVNVGCGGANAVGPSDTVEATFDITDDSELIIPFIDDVRGQCNPPAEVAIQLTKV